jgi:glucose/mannose-6-phosphate isomerase
MQKLGFVSDQSAIVTAAVKYLDSTRKKLAINVAEAKNDAKKLAIKLKDRIGVVYAGCDFYDVAAIRFKGQICENGKHLAYANIAPEFNHNELVGFEFPKALIKKLFVVWLAGPGDHKGVTNRVKVVDKILKAKRVPSMVVGGKGPNRLAEILSLVQFGDLATYYLALVNKTDPSPVHVINKLKSALEKMK